MTYGGRLQFFKMVKNNKYEYVGDIILQGEGILSILLHAHHI